MQEKQLECSVMWVSGLIKAISPLPQRALYKTTLSCMARSSGRMKSFQGLGPLPSVRSGAGLFSLQ